MIVSYGMHSIFVKQMLNSHSAVRELPHNCLVTAILEPGSQLQCRNWWKDEVRNINKNERGPEVRNSHEQLLREDNHGDIILYVYICI